MRKLLAIAIVALFIQSAAAQYVPLAYNRGPITGVGVWADTNDSPSSNGCTGSSTTCTLTSVASLAAGHVAFIQCFLTSPAYVASTNFGTSTTIWTNTGVGTNGFTNFTAAAWVPVTTLQASSLVITFNQAIGSGSSCRVRDVTLSAGTPKLDWAQQQLKAVVSATSVPGFTPLLTGTSDFVVQMENNDHVVSTACNTSPWTTRGLFDAANGPAYCVAQNVANGVVANGFTTSSFTGNAAAAGFAVGTDATAACNDLALMDSSGGTNGSNVLAAALNSSMFGSGGIWGTGGGTGATTLTWATAAQHNLLTATSTCDGHKTGAGSLGIKIANDVSTGFWLSHAWNPFNDSFSCGSWFVPHILTSDAQFYEEGACSTENLGGTDYVRPMVSAGQIYISAPADARGNPVFGTKYSFTQDAQYWITTQYNKYTSAPVSITSVANASGGNTVYTGTITGGGSNAFAGRKFLAYTCAQATNNGVFTVTASTTTTLTLNNPSGVTDTTCSATPSFHLMNIYDSSGSLLSAQGKLATATGPAQPSIANLGKAGDDIAAAGIFVYVSNPKYNFSGAFPVLP